MGNRTSRLAFVVVAALGFHLAAPSLAHADAKVKQLIKFYSKEARVCAKYAMGIASAKERAEPYVADADIAADVTTLGAIAAVVVAHCEAIDATLAVLDPRARYKSLQAEIERHEAIVRAGREASREALEDANDVIQRLIPKVNKLRASS